MSSLIQFDAHDRKLFEEKVSATVYGSVAVADRSGARLVEIGQVERGLPIAAIGGAEEAEQLLMALDGEFLS